MNYTRWFQEELLCTRISPAELSRRTKIHISHLCRIRDGKGFPSAGTAAQIAREGFGITDEREVEFSALLAGGFVPKCLKGDGHSCQMLGHCYIANRYRNLQGNNGNDCPDCV